jgi:DNA-directed RNA polymerase subunit beta'
MDGFIGTNGSSSLELRPMIELNEGELITLDLNELYQRVTYRNNTLIDFLARSSSTPRGLVVC